MTAAASAAYGIVPAQPPLPTVWSFPFHPVAGSQTSLLMSESLVGVSVAVTRQNAGSLAYVFVAPRAPGGVNDPASTIWAESIFAFGSVIPARCSHAVAAATGAG